MTHKFKVFVALLLTAMATATAQVSRTVMVNSNSGIILYPTNFWTVNALSARSGLSLGTAALSNASAFQPASGVLSNFATSPILQIGNGGTGASNAAGVRSNIGLGAPWLTNTNSTNFLTAIGVDTNFSGFTGARPWLTNTNTTNFRTAIGLGAAWLTNTNASGFRSAIQAADSTVSGTGVADKAYGIWDNPNDEYGLIISDSEVTLSQPDNFRTALGLSLAALTNTNVTNFRTAIGLGENDGVLFDSLTAINFQATAGGSNYVQFSSYSVEFGGVAASHTRTNLGLGATWLTNTNVTNFRTAIGLGATNTVLFGTILGGSIESTSFQVQVGENGIEFEEPSVAAITRTNLGLPLPALTNTNNANFLSALGIGTNSSPTFSNATVTNLLVTGNFTNQGTIYGLKTNVGPFEGIGNFFASNNTTLSNETLFRVGLAEATNRSAQFGFRVARTNNGGEGVAVFSVFGYNALMMIGPSDRSRTNTATNAGIEADIWSISPTNRVMTLITTNTGAMEMHRPIGFNTNNIAVDAPSNTTVTNPTGWIQFYVGTNSVRVPYYQ